MNRVPLSALALMLLISSHPAQADALKVSSTLTAATVYMDRATLTRRAVVDVPAGSHTVVFENLSASMMVDSLRAEGKAAGKVVLGALSHKLVSGTDLIAPREQALNDQLQAAEDQKRRIEAEKTGLTEKIAFLTSLSKEAAARTREEITQVDLNPDQWSQAASVVSADITTALKAVVEQDIALRAVEREIEKIKTELAMLSTNQRNHYAVMLPLEADSATTLTVDLSYQIPNASWTPIYDARLDTKTGKVDLIQYGSVQQNSGEDWSDIALTLSTAQPQRGAGLPDLTPLWLSLFQPYSYGVANRAISMQSMESMDAQVQNAMPASKAPEMAGAAEPPMQEASFKAATIDTGGFVSDYKIAGPSTVKADGTTSKLLIGAFESESKLQVQIKPQMSTDAYLVAQTTLKGEAPVLPGSVNLFRDGAFVGQGALPLLRPGQKQDLAFGVDDQIAVKRKVLKDERSKTGVIGQDQVIERHVVTEIQNLRTTPVEIAVLETIPVAQDKTIKVQMIEKETTSGYASDVRNVKGLLEWTQTLSPKDNTHIKLGWKVSWPADQQLSGL